MTVAPAHQKNVMAIADFVALNVKNRAIVETIIRNQAIPNLIAIASGEVRGDARNGWVSTREWLKFGDDMEFRTSANYAGIWWNSSSEVVYYMGMRDEEGAPLNGNHVYTIHYSPNDLPQKQVDSYWSLTLMSLPDYRVVPNEMERYNLNNMSELTFGQGGSLTLYIASKLPKGAPEGNWLPAPTGRPFVLNHRFYVPKQEVLTGKWYVPPINKKD